MSELLHAWALAPAALGTCCLAADRRRVRAPELAASVLMLLAMLDIAVGRLLAPVYWAALLLAAAMLLAAARRRGRRHADAAPAAATGMTLHTTLGLVVMAALVLGMGASTSGSGGTTTLDHHHGSALGAGAPAGLVLLAAAAYAAASGVAALRTHGILPRLQYALMGAATGAMGMAALIA